MQRVVFKAAFGKDGPYAIKVLCLLLAFQMCSDSGITERLVEYHTEQPPFDISTGAGIYTEAWCIKELHRQGKASSRAA
jgi:hypothetical protein